MFIGKQIDDLIAAGWHLIDSNPNSAALQDWKREVSNAFKDLLAPDYPYSPYGDDLAGRDARSNIPASEGLAIAAKERVRRGKT